MHTFILCMYNQMSRAKGEISLIAPHKHVTVNMLHKLRFSYALFMRYVQACSFRAKLQINSISTYVCCLIYNYTLYSKQYYSN